jgi:Amt family ammonium transporter
MLAGRGSEFQIEYPCHSPDQRRWFQMRMSPFEHNGERRVIVMHTDVTERRLAEETLRRQALFAPLTLAANRVLFMDRLSSAIERLRRDPAFSFALLYLDLDRFKEVNDDHGHAAGDELLIEVVRRLLHCLRTVDTIGRIGGDEFVVLLEGQATPTSGHAVIQRMESALSEPFYIREQTLHLTASIGVIYSAGLTPPLTADGLLSMADKAMYRIKIRRHESYPTA